MSSGQAASGNCPINNEIPYPAYGAVVRYRYTRLQYEGVPRKKWDLIAVSVYSNIPATLLYRYAGFAELAILLSYKGNFNFPTTQQSWYIYYIE